MSLRIEKLETAEANRTTEDEKKKDQPEEPIMMQTPLMITQSGFSAPVPGQPVSKGFLISKNDYVPLHNRVHRHVV